MSPRERFFRAGETYNSTLAATCIPPLLSFCIKCLYRTQRSQENKVSLFPDYNMSENTFFKMLDNQKVTWGLTASVSCLDGENEKCTQVIKKTLVGAAVS